MLSLLRARVVARVSMQTAGLRPALLARQHLVARTLMTTASLSEPAAKKAEKEKKNSDDAPKKKKKSKAAKKAKPSPRPRGRPKTKTKTKVDVSLKAPLEVRLQNSKLKGPSIIVRVLLRINLRTRLCPRAYFRDEDSRLGTAAATPPHGVYYLRVRALRTGHTKAVHPRKLQCPHARDCVRLARLV